MLDVSKKWVLITGAARGIGKLTALAFAKQGANLILHSRNLEHTKALEMELRAAGVEVFSVAAELSDQKAREKFLAEIDSKNLEISVVCNNAGLQTTYRENFWEIHESDYISIYQVNTIAPIHISCHFLPKMLRTGFGRVICTGSGIAEQPELMAYAAAKFALYKFVIDTSPKLKGTDVTLNLMDPGWLRTDLGGPNAPNSVETAIPGAIAAAFTNNSINGKWLSAQEYTGLSLEEAVQKMEAKT
jgi:short-subunit dehydrogenase